MKAFRPVSVLPLLAVVCASSPGRAHDLKIPIREVARGADRIAQVLSHYRASPPIPLPPSTKSEQLMLLGAAEIELVSGERDRALEILIGRIMDPEFQKLPQYVDGLLFASQLLEEDDEVFGAMQLSKTALVRGGTPEQMAEAGGRWLRLSRRNQRLDGRLEVYRLFEESGGLSAASEEIRSQAAYEAAFAMRSEGRFSDAIRLLAQIPAGSLYGSRATYLGAVLYVQAGKLDNALLWFTSLMSWPIQEDSPERMALEREVRDLAALSAGRLYFERSEHAQAAEAYERIGDDSPHRPDACYELAHLTFEAKEYKKALFWLQCVIDHGPRGERYVKAKLMHASLLAHMSRYEDALAAYRSTEVAFRREADLVRSALGNVSDPKALLFDAMERSAVIRGRDASPGPPTLFGDAWTPGVDHAYRVETSIGHASEDLHWMGEEVAGLMEHVASEHSFPALHTRKRNLERLLRDVQHLLGHASDLTLEAERSADASEHAMHSEDAKTSRRLLALLNTQAKSIEVDLIALDREESERRERALTALASVRFEIETLEAQARRLEGRADGPAQHLARSALSDLLEWFEEAHKRARDGELETFWVKKEHARQEIQALAQEKEEKLRELDRTGKELAEDAQDEEEDSPEKDRRAKALEALRAARAR